MRHDSRLVCAECCEPVQHVAPRTQLPYGANGLATPEYSHLDGEPLCPVMGPNGYQPAQPIQAD